MAVQVPSFRFPVATKVVLPGGNLYFSFRDPQLAWDADGAADGVEALTTDAGGHHAALHIDAHGRIVGGTYFGPDLAFECTNFVALFHLSETYLNRLRRYRVLVWFI